MNTDIIIVGCGVAGLYCALNLPEDKKITTVIETSKTNKPEKITTVVANKTRVGDRKYLKKRIDSKGNILATREVFKPTKKGPLSGRTSIVNAGHGYRPPTKDGVIFDEGASEESANAGLKKKGKKTRFEKISFFTSINL